MQEFVRRLPSSCSSHQLSPFFYTFVIFFSTKVGRVLCPQEGTPVCSIIFLLFVASYGNVIESERTNTFVHRRHTESNPAQAAEPARPWRQAARLGRSGDFLQGGYRGSAANCREVGSLQHPSTICFGCRRSRSVAAEGGTSRTGFGFCSFSPRTTDSHIPSCLVYP